MGQAVPAVSQSAVDRRRGAQHRPRGSSVRVRAVVPGGGGGPAAGAPGLAGAGSGADQLFWEHLFWVALESTRKDATVAGEPSLLPLLRS